MNINAKALLNCSAGFMMLWVLDNLRGHKTPALILGLFAHGMMPQYTPLRGSWLNQEPTPFEWGGKRAQRRLCNRQRRIP
jgi:hypothetical protein